MLNKRPEVRRFVKERGHANTYENLQVKYIMHLPPELVILDGDKELEKIPLSPLSTAEIHDLMKQKGFRVKALWADQPSESAAPARFSDRPPGLRGRLSHARARIAS